MADSDLPLHELLASAPFHTGGTVTCEWPVTLFYKSSTGSPACITFPTDANDSQRLKDLLDSCQPATFGKGSGKRGQEVLDPAYRDALCMSPKEFALNLPLFTSNILWDIQTLLQPEAASVTAELYKLNIYGPGGFFKSHRDTPRGPTMFGSLVVCLPAPFSGGELVVKNAAGVQYTHAWGTSKQPAKGDAATAGCSLQWAAFYSDVEHEILPVTEGHRITLTYNLYSTPKVPATATDAAASSSIQQSNIFSDTRILSSSTFGAALAQKLQDASWHASGATLGFALDHQYVDNAAMPTKLEPCMLKGSDLVLYRVASELGLVVRLVPLIKPLWYEPGGDKSSEDEEDKEARLPGGVLLGAEFQEFPEESSGWDEHYTGEKEFLIERHNATNRSNIVWVKAAESQHFMYKDSAAYFGNELCDKSWYVAAVMLVDVPKVPRTLPQSAQAALQSE